MSEQRPGTPNSPPSDYQGTSRTWRPVLIVGAVLIVIGLLGALPVYRADGETTTADGSDTFSDLAIMSGIKRRNLSEDFRGGEATAVMGGVDIDLRDARMESGEAVLDVSSIMGGVKIRIPENWTVVSEVDSVMGGFKDNTRHPATDDHRLVLKGTVVMGGIEISN
jgi:hypothetical protein